MVLAELLVSLENIVLGKFCLSRAKWDKCWTSIHGRVNSLSRKWRCNLHILRVGLDKVCIFCTETCEVVGFVYGCNVNSYFMIGVGLGARGWRLVVV